MEDYYKLLGVQPDDNREVVREAYRERKAAADAASPDGGSEHSSKLNRAWNVLSDDAQRAKYDDRLAEAKDAGTLVEGDGDVAVAARGSKGARARQPRRMIVQETEVNGVQLASNKDRGIAMAIDGLILFALVLIAPQFAMPTFVNDSHLVPYCVQELPGLNAIDCSNEISKAQSDRKGEVDDAKKAVKDTEASLEKAKDAKAPEDEIDDLTSQLAVDEQAVADTEKEYEDINLVFDDLLRKRQPLSLTLIGIAAAVAVLVFAIPSALTGRTPGKLARKIRLRKETGELPGLVAALKRYVPVIVVVAFGMLFQMPGMILLMATMFGVTSFNRNARRQGWHDRFAKTIVAAD